MFASKAVDDCKRLQVGATGTRERTDETKDCARRWREREGAGRLRREEDTRRRGRAGTRRDEAARAQKPHGVAGTPRPKPWERAPREKRRTRIDHTVRSRPYPLGRYPRWRPTVPRLVAHRGDARAFDIVAGNMQS